MGSVRHCAACLMAAQSYQREAGWGGQGPSPHKSRPVLRSCINMEIRRGWYGLVRIIYFRGRHPLLRTFSLPASSSPPTVLHILILRTTFLCYHHPQSCQTSRSSSPPFTFPFKLFYIRVGGSFLLRRCPGNLIQTEYKGTWKGWIGQRAGENNEVCPYSGKSWKVFSLPSLPVHQKSRGYYAMWSSCDERLSGFGLQQENWANTLVSIQQLPGVEATPSPRPQCGVRVSMVVSNRSAER